jgi:archaellum component FlaC
VNEELKQLLRLVLDEKLSPVVENQQKMQQDITEIKKAVGRIEETVNRLEEDQPKDISVMLQLVSRKLDIHNMDLEYLKGKAGKHDADINRINKMMES